MSDDVDTSDIPEVGEEFFKKARLVLPQASDNPETLRLYASIFEKPRCYSRGGPLYPPMEAEVAAAKALRFMADALEKQ